MSDGNGFWAQDGPSPEGDKDGASTRSPEGPITPAAGSALMGFMTGGLPGLLEALDATDGASFEDDVDDPEALRRAEDAVARELRGPGSGRASGSRPIDEAWTAVAMQVTPGDNAGLDDVVRSLESDGIDCGWDPYDPRDSVNFMPPTAGMAARNLFSVVVPVSQVGRARESLHGDPPSGVTYVWPATGTSPVAPRGIAPGDPDAGFGFAPSSAAKRSESKEGIPLSDNERFQRMASGGPSIATAIVLVFVIVGTLIAAGAVLVSILNG